MMHMERWTTVFASALAVASLGDIHVLEATPGRPARQDAQPFLHPEQPDKPAMPVITVRRPAKLPPHQAGLDAAVARAAAAQSQAAREASHSRGAQRLLSAANEVLAYGPVESASLIFYGAPATNSFTDIETCVSLARDLIRQAREAVHQASDEETETMPEWTGAVMRDADQLMTWADAVNLLVSDSINGEDSALRGRILARLLVFMESDHPDVVAAASLWSLVLCRTPEQRSALLREMPPALEQPAASTHPWGPLLRLKRCETDARQGDVVAAFALLVQQTEIAACKWLPPSELDLFKRSGAWFQLRLLDMWWSSLDQSTVADERAWCAARMKRIHGEYFQGDSTDVWAIIPVIPILTPSMPMAE